MIIIKVNGQEWKVDDGTSISDLLSRFKISPKVCALEKNGEIINRDDFGCTLLKSNDQIEIIRMMGGG